MELKLEIFKRLKRYILENGDRRTYCNMYNHNPHYDFGEFNVFLNPDIGQANINCDPKISDFDELVIQDWETDDIYFSIKMNKKKDGLEYDPAYKRHLGRYFEKMLRAIDEKEGGEGLS